jgi:hypothetical protein
MLFRIVSIALVAISFTTFQSSAEIINWATDSSKLPYEIGDIIIFEGANYVASATGSESPSVKPGNFVDIAEELEEVSKSLPPDPPTWTDEQLAKVQADAAALSAPDSNSSQSNGLVSLSVRGEVGTGDNIRIMGFVLAGTGNGKVLMRGLGPVLSDWGITDSLLPDPVIELHKYRDPSNIKTGGSDKDTTGSNDNYSTQSQANIASINSARALVVPLVNLHPNQAIALPSLNTGFYTMWLKDASGLTGIGNAAVDLYDSQGNTFTHVSSRGLINSAEPIFGSFQISGTESRRVFIRGRGPSLSAYGVTNTIADPKIVLYKYVNDPSDLLATPTIEPTELASNDDYETNASSSAEVKSFSVSLHGWPELSSTEPALLVDLQPGYYSAQLQTKSASDSGKNGWIGIDDVTSN